MKNSVLLILLSFFLLFPDCVNKKSNLTTAQEEMLISLKHEIKENLTTNLLPYWATKMVDTVNGGFYGRVDAKEQVYPDADKGGILNARLLWTFSSAYRVLGDSSYLNLATRAKDYIMTYFIDREYGGGYGTVKANGEPGDTRKGTLTQSYFIYAFAEYYRVTGDKTVLDEAVKIFELLEKHALDPEYNGYYEVFTRDWQRSHDRLLNEKSEKDEKTMISHLHILEAYAGLYRVWENDRMKERLSNILYIFNTKIVDQNTFHTIYFLDRQWNATTQIDSYGHDIEGSWLMVEAARLLGDKKLIEETEKLSLKVAGAAAEGLQSDGSLLTELDRSTGHKVTIRSWWEQAETIVGYLNAFEITHNQSYLDKAMNGWNYTKKYFIDYKNGGWFSLVDESGVPTGRDKANYWTCPYHNSRMCMEVIERIK